MTPLEEIYRRQAVARSCEARRVRIADMWDGEERRIAEDRREEERTLGPPDRRRAFSDDEILAFSSFLAEMRRRLVNHYLVVKP